MKYLPNLKRLLLHVTILFVLFSCGYTTSGILEHPAPINNCDITHHKAYSLQYNEETEQAYWVAWELAADELNGSAKRSNKFMEDPKITTGTATNADYYKSGFDRGHLAPAADMTFDDQAMQESFYYSNMAPQNPSFNRGIWKKLEAKSRAWAKIYNPVYIVAGPLFISEYQSIGKNNVAIPSHFYRAALVINDSIQQAIGFIIPNEKGNKPLDQYAVSIDSIESVSGLDLYPALRNRYEKKIEAQYDIKYWE